MEKDFVTIDQIIEMGIPYPTFSMWMTNGLIKVAYQSKTERYFWRTEVETLKRKYVH